MLRVLQHGRDILDFIHFRSENPQCSYAYTFFSIMYTNFLKGVIGGNRLIRRVFVEYVAQTV